MPGLAKHKMQVKRPLVIAAAIFVTLGAGTGIATAAGVVTLPFSSDGNTINGCYSPGGQLKVLTVHHASCPGGMTPIHWNVTGPQGVQGPQGIQGPQGPTGPAGTNVAAGQTCPSGQFVNGFSSGGDIICAPATTTTTAAACPANSQLTFQVTGSPAGDLAGLQYWPGGTKTMAVAGYSNCTVTVELPDGVINDSPGTNGWSVVSWTGFTSASGVVELPSCGSGSAFGTASYPSVNGNYPTCSDALDVNTSSDTFIVTAS
jgi:hypothetical protein